MAFKKKHITRREITKKKDQGRNFIKKNNKKEHVVP